MPVSEAASDLQAGFTDSPYQDATWEVVGESTQTDEFVPMKVNVLPSQAPVVDKMFADFGGITPQSGEARWHLPDHLAYKSQADRMAEEVQEASRQSFTEAELKALLAVEFEKGRQQGQIETIEGENIRMGALEKRIFDIIADLNVQIGEQLVRVEQQSVELSIDISKKIIDGAVEINPEYITQVVHQALGLTGGARVRKIRVSPQDMEFIQVVGVAKTLKEYDGSWEFEADESIKAGCIVETSGGEIDFQIDKSWERVRANVLRVLR